MITNGKENQLKGEEGEKFYVSYFQRLGYKNCKQAEKKSLYDSLGIDLVNIPYLIQIKTGIQKNLIPGKILTLMSAQISNNLPKNHVIIKENFNLFLIHHKGNNNIEEDVIYMSLDTYDYYLSMYKEIKILSTNFRKIESHIEFNKIVGINMLEFEKVLIKELRK